MSPHPDHGEKTYRGFGRLRDRVALVTGGDSGIGRAVAIAFAREGADVVIQHLGSERVEAEETVLWVERAERRGFAVPANLEPAGACYALVDRAIDRFGRIDLLVNNAAFQGETVDRFEKLEPERIAHTFRVNVEAMFHVTQRALGHMREGGAIVNSTSIQGFEPSPGILDYAATKAAIANFTRGLAKELLPRGIRVNAVAPGPVWTPLIVQSFDPENVTSFGEDNPMGRPAQPAEIAPPYVFLASDEARWVTGEVLAATGGWRIT